MTTLDKQAILSLCLILVCLGGCAKNDDNRHSAPRTPVVNEMPIVEDQCLRVQLFQQCVQLIPKDRSEHVNWADVIDECGQQAYYQALRPKDVVKPECYAPR